MLEFLFAPLTAYSPALAVFIFSAFILIFINIFYKVLIKQHDAKSIKQRVKDLNKDFKEAQSKKEMERSKKIMSDMMAENSKLMRMNMKPMMVSLVVVIIFLPAMSAFYGDVQGQLINNTAVVNLRGANHTLTVMDGVPALGDATPYMALSSIQPGCDSNCFVAHEGGRYEVNMNGNSVIVAPIVVSFPFSIPYIGYSLGWLGWYIFCSFPLVMMIRRFMKIYV